MVNDITLFACAPDLGTSSSNEQAFYLFQNELSSLGLCSLLHWPLMEFLCVNEMCGLHRRGSCDAYLPGYWTICLSLKLLPWEFQPYCKG